MDGIVLKFETATDSLSCYHSLEPRSHRFEQNRPQRGASRRERPPIAFLRARELLANLYELDVGAVCDRPQHVAPRAALLSKITYLPSKLSAARTSAQNPWCSGANGLVPVGRSCWHHSSHQSVPAQSRWYTPPFRSRSSRIPGGVVEVLRCAAGLR